MTELLNNRYEIRGILGRGGMGCVYRVADRKAKNRILAAKELRPDGLSPAKAQEALAQFRTEARILIRLDHPNLPKVHDYFSANNRHYIIMDQVKGATLASILGRRPGQPVDEQTAHLGRTYAEIERLNGLIRAMESTRAWRAHQWWQRRTS